MLDLRHRMFPSYTWNIHLNCDPVYDDIPFLCFQIYVGSPLGTVSHSMHHECSLTWCWYRNALCRHLTYRHLGFVDRMYKPIYVLTFPFNLNAAQSNRAFGCICQQFLLNHNENHPHHHVQYLQRTEPSTLRTMSRLNVTVYFGRKLTWVSDRSCILMRIFDVPSFAIVGLPHQNSSSGPCHLQ